MSRSVKFVLLGFCVVGLIANSASALIINYGDFVGTNVSYLQVTEDTRDEPQALFGPPTVQGDLMDFDPPSFTAAANPNVPSDITDGQLNFTVQSNVNSFAIGQLIIEEAGDFTLVGLGAAFAQATVGTTVRYKITHVGGSPVGFNCDGTGNMLFTPVGSGGNGDYRTPVDNGTAVPWEGLFTADIGALAASCNLNGPVTAVEVVIDNTLTAFASDGGSAFIAKKDFSGITIKIPEPSAFVAILGALGTLGALRRRFVA